MKKKTMVMMILGIMTAVLLVFGAACSSKDQDQKIEESAEQDVKGTPEDTSEAEPEGTPEITPEVTPEAVEESEAELCQVVHCNEFITLREMPAMSGAEICKIPLGSNVYYLENAENGFVKIEFEGQVGYSLASYLNFTKEDGAIFMKVYNCKESITLRKIPSTKAEEFCQISLGEKVIFRESAENGFYMVSYNGYTGYALAEYLIEW